MSSQTDSTTNQIDASAKTNDTTMSTPKDGEKTVNSNLNNGADDKKLQQPLTTTSTSTPSKTTTTTAVAAAAAAATTTTTVATTAAGTSSNTAATAQPAKSSIESEDTSDKRASSFNSNNFSNKSTVTNSTYKRVTQSTDAERATESDSLSNPNAASVSPYTGENSSSLTVLKTHPNYGGSNSHRGPHRQIGQTTDFHNNSDGHTSSSSENLSRTNLYIRGLTPTTTDQDLYNMCAKFGGIVSTKAIQDKVSGNCKGYGFVLFSAPQSAELAVAELTKTGVQAQMARVPNNHESLNKHSSYHNTTTNNNNNNHNNNSHYHHNHYTHANQHQNHHGNNNHNAGTSSMVNNHSHNNANHPNIADPTNLYLANLPTNMNEAELEALMSTFGPVVSTRILRDEGFNPRGVGFARMESRDKCQEIIEKLNGKPYKGSGEPLLVKFADGGNRKRHHNNHHHHHHHHNNSHHKMAHDNARWRESGDAVENVSQPNFEHQRNLPHGSHMADLSMMGPMSYSRIQPTFSPANGPYPASLGASTSTAQWMHPGSGQPWNVIPQLITPNNMGPSTQTAVPANYSFGHMTQLANQMQGLQITHHSGASMSGYMTQWPPVWPHHMPPPQQTPSHSVRTTAPMQSSPTNQHPQQQQRQQQQQQIPQVLTGATKTFTDDQEIPQAVSSKQLNSSDTDKQQIHAPL